MNEQLEDQETRIKLMRENIAYMTKMTPWAKRLGFEVTQIEQGHVWARQPYDTSLIGDVQTGVLHGGVITSVLDNVCGMACTTAMTEFRFVATLDLRIDYMRPAEPERDIIAEAECFHVTKTIAFCRAWAYHDSKEEKLIATATGAFAINKPRSVMGGVS